MTQAEKHVKVLDKKITELSDLLANLGKGKPTSELIRIIRGGGWTTPAEFDFATAAIDQLTEQVQLMERTLERVVVSAKLVGQAGVDLGRDAPVLGKKPTINRPNVNN